MRVALLITPALVVAGLLSVGPDAYGGVVTFRLGEQDFAHGAGPILVTSAESAGGNEAFPFNGTVFGDDRRAAFGRVRFTFHLPSPTTGVGSLTLGLIGLDSPPGAKPTVKLLIDGVQQPNDVFAGASSPNVRSSASVVSVPVASEMLSDGEVEVLVKAFRRGPGYPGNAISADFAALTVNAVGLNNGTPGGNGTDNPDGTDGPDQGGGGTDNPDHGGGGTNNPPAIPLPPAVMIGGLGLALAAVMRRRV